MTINEKIVALSIMLFFEIACTIICANETYHAYKEKRKLSCIASIYPIMFFSFTCVGIIWLMFNIK